MFRPGKIAVLIDLSGTLHVENVCVAGATEALKRLRDNPRFVIKFVTNTTKESLNRLHERLTKLGLEISPSEIFSSLSAAKQLIMRDNLRPMLFLEDAAYEDFIDVDTKEPNGVVIGLSPSKFNFPTMNAAFRLLLNGARLIAVHKGRYYRQKDGLSLGPGPFVEALEYAADIKSEVVGKPERTFFLMALQSLGEIVRPQNAVMVGDDVRDDVLGAINAGMHAILVKTGKYREGDELKIPEASRNCVNSIVEAVDLIEAM